MEDLNQGAWKSLHSVQWPAPSDRSEETWPLTLVYQEVCKPEDYWPDVDETIFMDIYTAASLGDCLGITEALERGEKVNGFSTKAGWTPLMFAAYRNHSSAALELITHGANVTLCTKRDGRSALIFAAAGGSFDLVCLLARFVIKQKHFPLLLAAEMVCDSNSVKYKEHLPWLKKDFSPVVQEISSLFQEQAFGVDTWDIYGWTPLMHAVCFGTSDTVKLLLKLGSNINNVDIHGRTPLILATEYEREDIVCILLNAGADVTCKMSTGITAYEYAAAAGSYRIAKMIQAASDSPFKNASRELRAVVLILESFGLSRYISLFVENNIDLIAFNKLTEDDLRQLGVTTMGPRKKLMAAIKYKLEV